MYLSSKYLLTAFTVIGAGLGAGLRSVPSRGLEVSEGDGRGGVQYGGTNTPWQVRTGTGEHNGGTPDSVLGPGMFSMEKCITLRPKGPAGITQIRNSSTEA